MRKHRSLLIAVMVIAATAATLFVGCKKEKDEAAATADRSETQALLNRIEAFQTLRDAVNSGAKTDGSMTVEEMRQTLDLVSNYEHSEHMTYCLNTVLDTLHVAMPTVDGEGRVSDTDVVATYNAFETALEKCMLGGNDGMDVPSYFSIVMPKIEAKDGGEIEIVFTRGEVNDDIDYYVRNPFEVTDNFKWGHKLGHCPFDSTARITDAAIELSKIYKYQIDEQHQGQSYIPCNVEYACYRPCVYTIPFITSIYYYDPDMEDCSDTWLFFQKGYFMEEPCIGYEEMNCYVHSIDRNIFFPNAPLHIGPTTNSPYHECVVKDADMYFSTGEIGKVHYVVIKYCDLLWSATPGGDV